MELQRRAFIFLTWRGHELLLLIYLYVDQEYSLKWRSLEFVWNYE